MTITFIDLFAGIGGFRISLEQLGCQCLAFAEIDKQAIKVYQSNFSNESNLGDITRLKTLPSNVDILTGGVPCQPWSIAGKSGGFNDPRGKLWHNVISLVEHNQPKAFIFENVKGLTEPRHKKSFDFIIGKLAAAGYRVKWQILNSYDFGLPQDRNRVFVVGIRNNIESSNSFAFPEPLNIHPKVYQFFPHIDFEEIDKKKFSTEVLFNGKNLSSRGRFAAADELNDFFIFADVRDGHSTIHSWELSQTTDREKLICQAILKNRRLKRYRHGYGNKDGVPLSFDTLSALITNLKEGELLELINTGILRKANDFAYDFVNSKVSGGIKGMHKVIMPGAKVIGTLTATGSKDFIAIKSIECQEPSLYKKAFIDEVYRKRNYLPLTSEDFKRLQGFPDSFKSAFLEITAKRQYGNAVSVPVVKAVAESLLKALI